jgi:hypothetical protein
LRAGDFQQAEQLYREILKKMIMTSRRTLGLSHALLKQQRLQDPFDHAAHGSGSNPFRCACPRTFGSAILARGDFRLSSKSSARRSPSTTNSSMAVRGLAMIDFYEKRTNDALAKLRRAVAMDSGEARLHFQPRPSGGARGKIYKKLPMRTNAFWIIAPRTDADRRARIRGLIDFLRYLGDSSRRSTTSAAPERTSVTFESIDNRPMYYGSTQRFQRICIDLCSIRDQECRCFRNRRAQNWA